MFARSSKPSVRSSLLNNSTVSALQIAESFRRFGISESTTSLIAVKLSTSSTFTHEYVNEHLTSTVEGELVEFCDKSLAQETDLARVKKIYKLTHPAHIIRNKLKPAYDEAAQVKEEVTLIELEMSILGMMALRGAG